MAVDVGVAAADRDVEDDVEPVIDALGPPGRPDPALADAEVLLAVVVPADLLVRGVPAVDDRRVGLVASQVGHGRRLLPKPLPSWQGPVVPSGFFWVRLPQCSVPEYCVPELTSSRTSISPVIGHLPGPSSQNPGQ